MVYICIPAFDEERTIGVVLWKIRQVMSEFGRDYQVLVVDDGSTDGTSDVMTPYARIMPVHVRRHQRREGYARSLEALVREAVERSEYPKRDVIVTIQADFTDEPEDIATLVKRVEGGADIVTGHVHLVEAETPRMVRWLRKGWDALLRRSRGGRIEGDQLSGFRAYRVMTLARTLETLGDRPLLTTDGWAANAELLRLAAPHARRAEAVDVQVRYGRRQRESRVEPLRVSRELMRLLTARVSTPAAPGPLAGAATAAPVAATASGGGDLGASGSGSGSRDRGRRSGRRGRGGRGRARKAAPDSA